jgi:hypothetical protein
VIVDLLAQAFYLPGFAGINEVLYFLAGESGIHNTEDRIQEPGAKPEDLTESRREGEAERKN